MRVGDCTGNTQLGYKLLGRPAGVLHEVYDPRMFYAIEVEVSEDFEQVRVSGTRSLLRFMVSSHSPVRALPPSSLADGRAQKLEALDLRDPASSALRTQVVLYAHPAPGRGLSVHLAGAAGR